MKKIFIILFMVVTFNISNIYAASANIKVSKTKAFVNDLVTITVTVNAGSWNLHVNGLNVKDSIVGYDLDSNVTTTKTYNLDTSNVGTFIITLTGDYTDYDTEETSNVNSSVSVVVSKNNNTIVDDKTNTNTNKNSNTNASTKSNNTTNNTTNNVNNNTVVEEAKGKEEIVKKISQVSKFQIVGYDIDFDEDTLSYNIDINNNVDQLYIIVEGESIEVTGDKLVDITNKLYITVTIKSDDKSINYRINLNRDKEYLNNKVCSNNKSFVDKIPLLCNIILVLTIVILFYKYKNVKNK